MLVMILEKVPTSLKGELSRWLIEPKAGVFLGSPTARIRDKLWDKAIRKRKHGYVLQIWSDSSPQGYGFRSEGDSCRQMHDWLLALYLTGFFSSFPYKYPNYRYDGYRAYTNTYSYHNFIPGYHT